MLTLLGSLLGFLGSLCPDVLKMVNENRDRSHELALFEMQIKMMKARHDHEATTVEGMRSSQALEALYAHARPVGVKWVDALGGTVRPVITYTFFILYAIVKVSQIILLMHSEADAPLSLLKGFAYLWHEEDQALFATVMSFWFGQRSLKRIKG